MIFGRIVRPKGVTARQLKQMIGNAYDVNMFARVLARVVLSVGLVPKVMDKWGDAGDLAVESDDDSD